MSRGTLIEKLKTDIAEGRVVIIAGTGVSVAACSNQEIDCYKVATWTGLLEHGVQYCKEIGAADDDDVNLLTQQINSGKSAFLIGAAEVISARMKSKSDGTFRGWLKNTIGQLKVQCSDVPQMLAALPGVLATLNYDNLLEDATGKRSITWLKTDDVQDVLLRTVDDAVLHLHGWFKEPESVILGLSSYLAVKDHPHAKAVLNLFTLDRTLLFVGCGDTVLDPNFTRLIEWGKEALHEVAPRHYLLCRTSEIAKFQGMLSSAPWLQPLGYGADYIDLVPFLRSLIPIGGDSKLTRPRLSGGPGFDLESYQQAMRKRYSRLKLEELDPTTHDIRQLTLTGMFIEQNARECSDFMPRVFELPKELQRRLREAGELEGGLFDEEVLQQHRRAYSEQLPRPVLEIVRAPTFPRLVILGDPGSGKSTLLQYLVLAWAERAVHTLSQEALPLFIELREYARLRHEGMADGFLGYLHDGASVRWHFDRDQLDAWLKTNPCLILFDGLDEIFDSTLRRETSTAIHRFADEYPLARVIVTSRIIGYQHQAWRDEGFRHFMLQELDEAQISGFLARWHRAAYEEAAKGEAKHALLTRAIEDSGAIRELAGNPLLLTMMAIINRTQDLPRDRAELYEQCARLLLHQWKVDLAFAHDPELAKASLDYKDKRGLLLSVARTMQNSECGLAGNLIDETTLEATIADGLGSVPGLRPERAARALMEQLRGRNFMLCSVGGHSYAFVHRTFLEYFCAVEIRTRFETEQSLSLDGLRTDVFSHWREETWHEVLCLLAGMIAPHFVQEILKWLVTQPDLDDNCHNVFLAARCVGEVRKRTELGVWEALIRHRTKELIRFDLRHQYDPWDDDGRIVERIRRRAMGTVATVWYGLSETSDWLKTCAQSEEDPSVRHGALEALARGWKDDPDILPWLKTCAQSDETPYVRHGALEALARGWKGDPDTLLIIKACARSDESEYVRQSALETLALGWTDDPDTFQIINACAQSDDSWDVRRTAVEVRARNWKDDPETLPWLKELAQFSENDGIVVSALDALVLGWQDDPDTLPILKACAQPHENEYVRQSAVEALARGWRDDPDTLPTIKAYIRSDKHWSVRRSALEVFAFGWKDDPDTWPILKVCAQSDEHWVVRQSAIQALARGWKADPGTLPILKACVKSDESEYVRQSAVQALARAWNDDPNILPWLKACAQSDNVAYVRQGAVAALARWWKDDPDTLPWLKTCAQSDSNADVRLGALEALVLCWKNDPATLQILKERAKSDESGDVRQSALKALARGWKNDPATLPILKERAKSDESGGVRQCAIEALARGWRNDLETLPWLKQYVHSDMSGKVRQSALQALARGWRDDPDTLAILKLCARSDEDVEVRLSAIEALVEGWRGDSDILPILKALVQSDGNAEVRQSALYVLLEEWKSIPDTLSIIKNRALSDEDGDVRQVALEALVRRWKDDPSTLQILKERLLSDESAVVRQSALDALVRRWGDDPETLSILEARAQFDDDADVRQYAEWVLARKSRQRLLKQAG